MIILLLKGIKMCKCFACNFWNGLKNPNNQYVCFRTARKWQGAGERAFNVARLRLLTGIMQVWSILASLKKSIFDFSSPPALTSWTSALQLVNPHFWMDSIFAVMSGDADKLRIRAKHQVAHSLLQVFSFMELVGALVLTHALWTVKI